MIVSFFCSRWGSEHLSWDEFCHKVKSAGYTGIEAAIPFDIQEKKQLKVALQKYNLHLVGQYYQSFEKDFECHKKNFMMHLENIATLEPVIIDSQTGKDFFRFEQNAELFDIAKQFSEISGIQVAHETHRNKALFSAHVAKDIFTKYPDIAITADFSHWCCVSESLLEQQQEAIDLAVTKVIHIHARVGSSQSAQVSDPRASEWELELNTHLKWWDAIVAYHIRKGNENLSITTEFGPFPYMPAMPFTRAPLSNQWDINLFMMDLLKKRYN